MIELTGNRAYHMDCMELMRDVPDKYFDLAVVDPPYGGGSGGADRALRGGGADWESRARSRFGGLFDRYHVETGKDVLPARGCL